MSKNYYLNTFKIITNILPYYCKNIIRRNQNKHGGDIMLFLKKTLKKQIELLSEKMEENKIKEYVTLMGDTKKLLWKNFISGVSKGIGTGIGFTILGAIVLLILRKIVLLNIPIIGRYLKDILDIIEVSN